MQVLADNNFGKIPLYWRPREITSSGSSVKTSCRLPDSRLAAYGDVDNRVRAIAREIFGLKTIIWYPGRSRFQGENTCIGLLTRSFTRSGGLEAHGGA